MGKPLLSFDTATLDDARASLKMPFLSGYFFTLIESQTAPVSITEYNSVFPDSNFYLNMNLSLQNTSGEVSGQGEIYLDLSECEPGSITVNLVDNDQACAQIGQAFQTLFSQASDSEKRYVLGSFDSSGQDNPLDPVSFEVRTQASPAGQGDGAVVAFVQTQASLDSGYPAGTLPTSQSGFPYLIPDDADSEGMALFSGSTIISSRTLFKHILAPAYSSQMYINFNVIHAEDPTMACELSAAKGSSFSGNSGIYASWDYSDHNYANYYYQVWSGNSKGVSQPVYFPMSVEDGNGQQTAAFTITPSRDGLNAVMPAQTGKFSFYVNYTDDRTPGSDYGGIRGNEIAYSINADWTVSIEKETNHVHFASSASSNTGVFKHTDGFPNYTDDGIAALSNSTRACVDTTERAIAGVNIPDIDVFTLSNILFPNNNALHLGDASIPGDMALFGQIVPSPSSLLLQPAEATVAAGQSCTFTLATEGAGAVDWSIRSPSNLDVAGRIQPGNDGTALYVAPGRAQLSAASATEVVTARFTAADGSPASASAVVIVSGSDINLNPGFRYAVSGAAPVTFTASVVGNPDAGVDWQGATATGSPAPGIHQATCAPALPAGQTYALQTVSASVNGAGATTAGLLVVAPGLHPRLIVGGGSWASGNPSEVATGGLTPLPPYGERQLTALASDLQNGGYRDVTASCAWQVLGGAAQGAIDAQGRYVAPATFSGTTAVVMAIYGGEDFGYTVIPLTPGN